MARHRSPHGRRARPHGLVEGALAVAVPHVHIAAGGLAESTAKPGRLVALAVAGATVAAAGQQLLVHGAPVVADGATALRTALGDVFGPEPVVGVAAPEQVASIAAVQPLVVDAAGLVKAADLQAAAAEQARLAEEARVAEAARVAEEARRAEEARVAAEAQAAR
ncbi:hypothetical protein, partial [Pseudonocardia lacus]|uniref:hypothetical protein n=1 Tax=Pseudonocardia lacus TaxID=2835865 RepID=UPI001BDCA372